MPIRLPFQKREAGQSAVMVSLLIMIVAMMIAFTTNIGKLVTERIAMQNAADLAAYAGGATQAGLMNKIRQHNQKIWQTLVQTRTQLKPTDAAPIFGYQENVCPVCVPPLSIACPGPYQNQGAEAVVRLAKQQIDMESQQVRMNVLPKFQTLPEQAARDTADQNYKGTRIEVLGGSRSGPPLKQSDVHIDYRGWGTVSFPFCPFNGSPAGSIPLTEHTAKSWFYRDPSARGEVQFAVKASGTPASPFLDGAYLGNYFGSCGGTSSRCELSALAAAHPMRGKMGTIDGGNLSDAYENMWNGPGTSNSINNSIQAGPGQVDVPTVLMPSQVIGRTYKDYKVRYVAIFEREASFVNGGPITSLSMGGKIRH